MIPRMPVAVYDPGAAVEGRLPVERVGTPGRAWLELRKSVLVYHTGNWVSASTTFIPIEWIRVFEGLRRDVRQLWQGLIALMLALLLSLPVVALLRYTARTPFDQGLLAVLTLLLAFTLGAAGWRLGQYARRRSYTVLQVAGHPFELRILFWRTPGSLPELDSLVAALRHGTETMEEKGLHPVRMTHVWRRTNPYRLVLLQGAAVGFVLYLALLTWDTLAGIGVAQAFPRRFYLVVLLPAVTNLAWTALREAYSFHKLPAFHAALRAYRRRALGETIHALGQVLRVDPDHYAGRVLMIQVCTEHEEFEEAARHCEYLERAYPVLATHLKANLWAIRRIYERMK